MTDDLTGDHWIAALAEKIYVALLASPCLTPEQGSAAFESVRRRFARAEAFAELAMEFVGDVIAGHGVAVPPPMPGMRAPVETLMQAEMDARRAREKLGLTPLAYARIMKDLSS